jgi:hypothetical protein
MFYLGGSVFPASREQLVAAVAQGLRRLLTLPARDIMRIEGGKYPDFDKVVIDLTGAKSAGDQLPPEPKPQGAVEPGVSAARLEAIARPLYLREAPIELSLTADTARFDYGRDAGGNAMLLLREAKNGQVTVQVPRAGLDALVTAAAREGAAKQGVQIQETSIHLTQLDPRSVSADIRIKAKKLFITATLLVRGKLSVDDALNARVYDLAVSGEGMLGELASSTIRPHLQQMDGKIFPLSALPLGEVRLKDLTLSVGDPLKVHATFGS